ncbi:MAG: hypothetical protein GVY08_01040 [Bacteroidetes bacterium]|jgi:hypothetical protein|nr:hypothetical protein [Bacteroidota bacterium]
MGDALRSDVPVREACSFLAVDVQNVGYRSGINDLITNKTVTIARQSKQELRCTIQQSETSSDEVPIPVCIDNVLFVLSQKLIVSDGVLILHALDEGK